MDAKFYIKSLNSSPNVGEGSKGVEGNSEGLLTIYTTPSYMHVISNDTSLNNKVIAIDDVKKSPIKDNLSLSFNGILLYKERPILNSDLYTIAFESGFHVPPEPIIQLNLQVIKFKDMDNSYNIPQEIKDKFGDYYIFAPVKAGGSMS
jgi:hypothetical protein